jgi:hypothetical protein
MYRAALLRFEGNPAEALAEAERTFEVMGFGISNDPLKEAFLEAVEAAFELGDLAKVEELLKMLDDVPRGKRPRYLEAHVLRFKARLAAARGDDAIVESRFRTAAGMFVEMAVPFWAAVVQLEHAEWLAERRADEATPLLAGSEPVFERLKARPYIERARALVAHPVEAS